MQLAVVAILVLALEVVNAVGDIAGLLYLRHKASLAYGVNSARGNEEDITLPHVVPGQSLSDGTVIHHGLILLRGEGFGKAVVEERVWSLWFESVPHLRLAPWLAMPAGNLVIGVYLYGEVLMGVYELYEQRELVAEALIVLLPHELFLESGHQRIERHTLIFTLGNNRLAALYT